MSDKKAATSRNQDRRNGKKFARLKETDEFGRPLTGKGKPTGRSVKGMSIRKLEERHQAELKRQMEIVSQRKFQESLKGVSA